MRPEDPVALALVVYPVNLRRVGVDARLLVGDDGVIVPRAFPELVGDVDIFRGPLVALVVRNDAVEAEVLRRVVADAGDDVPADAAIAQMVEGRDLAGEVEGMVLHDRAREGEPDMLGRFDQRGRQDRGIVDRDLHGFADEGVPAAFVDRVDADHVGEEEVVETTALE